LKETPKKAPSIEKSSPSVVERREIKKSVDAKILVWMISGVIATFLIANGYSTVLKLLGAQPFYSWNFEADFLLQGRGNIESFWGVINGVVADYLIGMANAIVIGLVLDWLGIKFYGLKGIGVAFTNWIALGFMTQVFPQLFTYKITPFNYVTYIFGYIAFGALTAYLIVKLTRKYEFNN
jgi:hypothetical protein